jgi:hypothetical protein
MAGVAQLVEGVGEVNLGFVLDQKRARPGQ